MGEDRGGVALILYPKNFSLRRIVFQLEIYTFLQYKDNSPIGQPLGEEEGVVALTLFLLKFPGE
ncbi:hypothetical protein GCM10020331_056880 [Ectobacillus funiculus]